MIGKIDQYNSQRGFGFIKSSQGNRLFVHRTAFTTNARISVGCRVRYEVARGSRGFQAVKVTPLSSLH